MASLNLFLSVEAERHCGGEAAVPVPTVLGALSACATSGSRGAVAASGSGVPAAVASRLPLWIASRLARSLAFSAASNAAFSLSEAAMRAFSFSALSVAAFSAAIWAFAVDSIVSLIAIQLGIDFRPSGNFRGQLSIGFGLRYADYWVDVVRVVSSPAMEIIHDRIVQPEPVCVRA